MPPHPAASHAVIPPSLMKRVLGALSIFTLVMTAPQVVAVWSGRRVTGVSLISWSAYLVSALVWLVYGLRKRDRNIFLPCLGWIAMDAAVILGVVIHR